MNIAENTITALEMYLNKQFTESDLQELISENMISKELLDQYLQEAVLKNKVHPVAALGAGAALGAAGAGIAHAMTKKTLVDQAKEALSKIDKEQVSKIAQDGVDNLKSLGHEALNLGQTLIGQ